MDDTPAPPPAAPDPTPGAPDRRAVWLEVLAVLCVGAVPSLAANAAYLLDPADRPAPHAYWLDAVTLMVLSGCTVFVTVYLMGRSGESWERFGLPRPRVLDLPLGGFLLLVALVVWSRMPPVPDIGGPPPGGRFVGPRGFEYALLVPKYLLAALAEELVMRAYLITRLTVLLRSRGEAVLFAAAVFAACHAYQGSVGTAHALVFGLTYGVIFLALGRVWPLVLGHALYNVRIELLVG